MKNFLKTKLIIAFAIILGVSTIISCKKSEEVFEANGNTLTSKNTVVIVDPVVVGQLHNKVFDEIAYNFQTLNTGQNPLDNALLFSLKATENIYGSRVTEREKACILQNGKDYIYTLHTSGDDRYKVAKALMHDQLQDEYLNFFFEKIDYLIYETDLKYSETCKELDALDALIKDAHISEGTKNGYNVFTSVMRHSLFKYYEVVADASHPFHKYTTTKADVGSWVVSDAMGAWAGVQMGCPAGPLGIIIGGVCVGAMTSAVETSVSDLITSWFK